MGMAAILINEPWPFEQIFHPPFTEGSIRNLKKIGPVVSDEKPFKSVDGWQTDVRTYVQQATSDHNSSSWAFY